MRTIANSDATLGAMVEGLDLAKGFPDAEFPAMLQALAEHGVLRIPDQHIEPEHLKTFAARFGTLEINVANTFQEPGHPEVMVLSNIKKDGKPIGLLDAGQDWHTDMSYSAEVAFANVLHGITIPRRNGLALGSTEFANMYMAYDDLPTDVRERLKDAAATHDFNKFWEEMRRRPGSMRAPLTPEQRAKKPPVSHPVNGRMALYANPGYTMRIDGWEKAESDAMLEFLFAHQL